MRKILLTLLTFVALVAAPVSGFCASSADLSAAQVQTLKEISTKITVVEDLAARHVITPEQAAEADHLYTDDAKAIVGHDVTAQEIQQLVSNAEKTEGLGPVANFFVVVAGVLVLLAVVGLIGFYLSDLLAAIPVGVYEVLAYVGAGGLMASGHLWQPFTLGFVRVEPLWFTVPGALALAGSLFLTHNLHFKKSGRGETGYMGPGLINFPTVMFLVCSVAWGAMALFYSHAFPAAGIPHILAFGAVVALQAALGFSVITMPGCIALGWTSDSQVPRSVTSSLIILVGYIALKLSNGITGDLALFETGALFMGAFVYYLGLLVMSSKWYVFAGKNGRNEGSYVLMQVLTIASGIAAWYIGSAFHMGALLGIGGTFFTIYLLEKYYEIPWKGVGWAWSLLGVAGILYFIVGIASKHPEYFVWGIH